MFVYTCVTNNRDALRKPTIDGNYIAYLPEYRSIDGWNVMKHTCLFIDGSRDARMVKILMPPGDSLWVDGNILPQIDMCELESFINEFDICVHAHAHRNCIYDEADAVIKYGLDDPDLVKKQIDRYRNSGYPKNNGLVETGVLLRRDTPTVREFNRLWWEEVCRGSKRDQLSFNYCLWKTGIRIGYFPNSITTSNIFQYTSHS